MTTNDIPYVHAAPPESTDQLTDAFLRLRETISDLESRLDAAKKRAAELEAKIIDAYARLGRTSETRNGYTLSVREELWPSIGALLDNGEPDPLARDAFAAACANDPELSDLVAQTVNYHRLRSYICDLERDELGNPALPPSIAPYVQVAHKWRISVRKASSKSAAPPVRADTPMNTYHAHNERKRREQ